MFKEDFKYYKRRCRPPVYDNVVDLSLVDLPLEKVLQRHPCINDKLNICRPNVKHYGLVDVSQWKIFEFKDKMGLIFIVNPFTKEGQQFWVEKCLQEYTKKPNKLNLDPFNELEPDENWWEAVQVETERGNCLLRKLRWATLGYHHNWDTKEYSDEAHTEFPVELAELSSFIVQVLGDPACDSYQAEAAIVNFYHLDSTLSGHKDVSEPNMNSPLLSISFGQSAVFLVGGETLEEPATPMFVRSGDIVVMSAHARHCYHGVPRVLPARHRPWATLDSGDTDDWEHSRCGRYLQTARINMNIRQVLLPGQRLINR